MDPEEKYYKLKSENDRQKEHWHVCSFSVMWSRNYLN